jgi:PTH1 family peptidyl-tRNA hydrolase
MPPEFLVVGLGNPGEAYRLTPHNLGFLVVDRLAEAHAIRVTRKENMSLVGLGTVAGKPVALAQPQTFMNVNGPAVKGLLERYGLTPGQLLVIYDELALPWGALRIRTCGSAGGHNGVKSLLSSLGTDQFIRVRIGIDPGANRGDAAKFVLAPFRRAQMQEVEEMVARAAEAVETIIAEGAQTAMAKYNRRAGGLQNEEA